MKKDCHIHSHYCQHGSNDPFEEYIEKAILENIDEMSFTEHLPLPNMPIDKDFLLECAIEKEDTIKYIDEVKKYKEIYKDKIKINLGFEIDYVEGFEKDTKADLDKYGPILEDSILSVHFVKYKENYYAIDMLSDFEILLNKLGSLEKVYDLYFETILKSLKAELGKYKPKRIGHITIVRKFATKYPYKYKNIVLLDEIFKFMKENNYEVDLNTSGLRKNFCREVYGEYVMEFINKYNVKFTYGSDSHRACDVGCDIKDVL